MNQDTTSQPKPNALPMQIPGFHGYKLIQHFGKSLDDLFEWFAQRSELLEAAFVSV